MNIEIEQISNFLNKEEASKSEILDACSNLNIKNTTKIFKNLERKQHGVYYLKMKQETSNVIPMEKYNKNEDHVSESAGYVPEKDPCFVPFGEFDVINKVIASEKFMPTLITGESGNGKTKMVQEACAINNRRFYRMNVTVETDELDILGTYVLINGNTIWQDSPLVEAAKTGGVVLLDEIFAGNPARMLALQGILEGNPFLIKKTGERIVPKKGFNIIATDNTKGNGSESGRYLGTNIQNSAFLERFVVCVEHDYPSKNKEIQMLNKYVKHHNIDLGEDKFTDKLAQWADVTRKSYKDEAIDELITTRRLFHVLDIFSLLGDKEQAINLAISRFDDEVKQSFLSLYKKIDETVKDPDHQPVDIKNRVTLEEVVTDYYESKYSTQIPEELKTFILTNLHSDVQQTYDMENDMELLIKLRGEINKLILSAD